MFYLSKIIFPQNENYMKPIYKNQMKGEHLGQNVCVCVWVSGIHSFGFTSTILKYLLENEK